MVIKLDILEVAVMEIFGECNKRKIKVFELYDDKNLAELYVLRNINKG